MYVCRKPLASSPMSRQHIDSCHRCQLILHSDHGRCCIYWTTDLMVQIKGLVNCTYSTTLYSVLRTLSTGRAGIQCTLFRIGFRLAIRLNPFNHSIHFMQLTLNPSRSNFQTKSGQVIESTIVDIHSTTCPSYICLIRTVFPIFYFLFSPSLYNNEN